MSNVTNNQQKTPYQFYINEIARALINHRAAIMVGSGFSKNASKNFPSWQELGNQIFERLHGRKPDENERYVNPMRLAGELESVYGRSALDSIIREIPDTVEPSDVHTKLLELPWVDVFTTNYDTLLERAAAKIAAIKYDTVITLEDLSCVNRPRIIKLHGSLPSNRPFVITEEDYRRYPKDNSVFVNTVQQSLIENVFCLIGFSGNDPNFLNWIGWVRDNLGGNYELKIYLLNIGDEVSEPQRSLLLHRNIVTINLCQVYEKETDSTDRINSLLVRFFDDIKRIIRENSLERPICWGPDESPSLQPQNHEHEIKTIVNAWQTIRNNYFGWVILPSSQRNALWTHTQQWLSNFPHIVSTLPQQLAYDFTYELVWRLDRCLLPLLFLEVEEQCCKMVYDEEWQKQEFSKWYELALILLREYRLNGKTDLWNKLVSEVEKDKPKLSEEQSAAFFYERALQALFTFDVPLLRKRLETWKETKSLPFWEAKRASLWAELGEIEIAKTLLETAIGTIRMQINATTVEKRLTLFSQEGCILSILQRVDIADSFQKGIPDFQSILRTYEDRREFLRRYRCDLNEEESAFKAALGQEPTAPKEETKTTDSFDIGRVNVNHSFSMVFNDKDAILGFSFLTYTEQCGIPLKLLNMNFETPSTIGAAKRIQQYSHYLSFVTLSRCGDAKQSDWFFDRNVLLRLNVSDIDKYVSLCIVAVKNSQNEIAKLNNPIVDKNLGAEYAIVMPEFLSRLCTKCSIETLQKIADFIVELYLLPEKEKQVFRGIDNLVQRLLSSYPKNKAEQLFETIKKINWKPVLNNPIVEREFIDPYLPFFQHFGNVITPSQEEIEAALKKLESIEERQNGMMLCLPLQRTFSDEQNKKYAELLWDTRFLDRNTGFPQTRVFTRCSFLGMPHPEGIDVVKLFKKLTLENIENIDVFTQEYATLYQNGHPVSITNGYSIACDEWKNGFGIFASCRVSLNIQETKKLLDYIRNYWNNNKQFLDETFNKNCMFGSVSDEFKARFDVLSKIILFVIIPNIAETNANETSDIRQELDALLNEMELKSLNMGAVKLASLAIFPDRSEQIEQYIRQTFVRYIKKEVDEVILGIWVLLVMKHKKIPVEIDTYKFISYITEHIKFWLSPGLFSALHYCGNIISETSEFFDEKVVKEILPVLEILIKETNLVNTESRILESNRLADRQEAMRLASAVFKYFENQNNEQPAEILQWMECAKSDNEFWEIRNQWET